MNEIGRVLWRSAKDNAPWVVLAAVVAAIAWGVACPPSADTGQAKAKPAPAQGLHWHAEHRFDPKTCGYCANEVKRKQAFQTILHSFPGHVGDPNTCPYCADTHETIRRLKSVPDGGETEIPGRLVSPDGLRLKSDDQGDGADGLEPMEDPKARPAPPREGANPPAGAPPR
jgi:hypothetical protein